MDKTDPKLSFTATRYPNRKSYFYSYKGRKNKYGSYSKLYIYSHHFKFFARNIKNQTETMILH